MEYFDYDDSETKEWYVNLQEKLYKKATSYKYCAISEGWDCLALGLLFDVEGFIKSLRG